MQAWRAAWYRWTTEEEGPSLISGLPDELLVLIFGCMPMRDLANARLVCIRWNAVIITDVENGVWLKQRGTYHVEQREREERSRSTQETTCKRLGFKCTRASVFALFPFPSLPYLMAIRNPNNKSDFPELRGLDYEWSRGWVTVSCIMCVTCPCMCPCYWCMFFALFQCTDL